MPWIARTAVFGWGLLTALVFSTQILLANGAPEARSPKVSWVLILGDQDEAKHPCQDDNYFRLESEGRLQIAPLSRVSKEEYRCASEWDSATHTNLQSIVNDLSLSQTPRSSG